MRNFALAVVLVAALAGPARAVDVVFDAQGFEPYAAGALAGQDGWRKNDFDPLQPNTTAVIGEAPAGYGKALCFENVGNTESSVAVGFPDLVGSYTNAVVAFDLYREGSGMENTLWWSAVGSPSTAMYGLVEGSASPRVLPIGYLGGGPSVPLDPSRWMRVAVEYDLARGRATALVDGQVLAMDVPVGTDSNFNGWTFTDQYTGLGAPGRRAYVDNVRLLAANAPIIPEPATLVLLASALPLALRRKIGKSAR